MKCAYCRKLARTALRILLRCVTLFVFLCRLSLRCVLRCDLFHFVFLRVSRYTFLCCFLSSFAFFSMPFDYQPSFTLSQPFLGVVAVHNHTSV